MKKLLFIFALVTVYGLSISTVNAVVTVKKTENTVEVTESKTIKSDNLKEKTKKESKAVKSENCADQKSKAEGCSDAKAASCDEAKAANCKEAQAADCSSKSKADAEGCADKAKKSSDCSGK